MFWIVMVLYSLYWIYRLFWTMNRKLFERSLLRFLIQFWVMTSAILHRPHNVMLLPMQVLSSYIVESVLSTYGGGDDANIFAHICLGNVFYFYQVVSKFKTGDNDSVGKESVSLLFATIII